MDDLKGNRGYWKLKKEILHHTLCGTRFGKFYWPIVRTHSEMNDITYALRYLAHCMKICNFGINGNNSVKTSRKVSLMDTCVMNNFPNPRQQTQNCNTCVFYEAKYKWNKLIISFIWCDIYWDESLQLLTWFVCDRCLWIFVGSTHNWLLSTRQFFFFSHNHRLVSSVVWIQKTARWEKEWRFVAHDFHKISTFPENNTAIPIS